jgi:hypothetical protein
VCFPREDSAQACCTQQGVRPHSILSGERSVGFGSIVDAQVISCAVIEDVEDVV